MKESTKLKCDNCGKELKGFIRFGGEFWEHPKGSSWEDYRKVIKRFCSEECYKEHRLKEDQELKRVVLSNNSEKFKRFKFLLKRNIEGLIDIIILMAVIISISYIVITTNLGDIKIKIVVAMGIFLPVIIALAFIIIRIIKHPWIVISPIL